MCLTSLRLAAPAEAAVTLSSSLACASVIGWCCPARAAAAPMAAAAPPTMKARLDVWFFGLFGSLFGSGLSCSLTGPSCSLGRWDR